MKNYLFCVNDENDENDGEEFLVGAYDDDEAWQIAVENFGENVAFLDFLSDEEAEESGLDEY